MGSEWKPRTIWKGAAHLVGKRPRLRDWCNFTNTEKQVYFQAVFDAARDVGIQNIVRGFFAVRNQDGTYVRPSYGIVDLYESPAPRFSEEFEH